MSKDIQTFEGSRIATLILSSQSINEYGWADFLLAIDSKGQAILRMPSGWPFDRWGPLTTTQKMEWERENAALGPKGESPMAQPDEAVVVEWPRGLEGECEGIDASMFSDDAFHDRHQRAKLRAAMKRWESAMNEIEIDQESD